VSEAAKLLAPQPQPEPGEELNLVNLPTDLLVRPPPPAAAFELPGWWSAGARGARAARRAPPPRGPARPPQVLL